MGMPKEAHPSPSVCTEPPSSTMDVWKQGTPSSRASSWPTLHCQRVQVDKLSISPWSTSMQAAVHTQGTQKVCLLHEDMMGIQGKPGTAPGVGHVCGIQRAVLALPGAVRVLGAAVRIERPVHGRHLPLPAAALRLPHHKLRACQGLPLAQPMQCRSRQPGAALLWRLRCTTAARPDQVSPAGRCRECMESHAAAPAP